MLDAVIIAQYQRMTHYGIAGFGTAAAYAKALGFKDDAAKLSAATKEIYGGDEFMSKLADTLGQHGRRYLTSIPRRRIDGSSSGSGRCDEPFT